jgi:hypothetical protein
MTGLTIYASANSPHLPLGIYSFTIIDEVIKYWLQNLYFLVNLAKNLSLLTSKKDNTYHETKIPPECSSSVTNVNIFRMPSSYNQNIKSTSTKLLKKKELQTLPVPTNTLFYILRILLLICSYIVRHSCHPRRANTNVVTTYSNNTFLQYSCLYYVQVSVKIYNIQKVFIEMIV